MKYDTSGDKKLNPIEITDLVKTFGNFTSVDHLTLSVKKGSFTGLLGPNGAGKSTTLKVLTNLITATSGDVCLNGQDVQKHPKKALTGVGTVVETPEFYLYLTPRETMKYIGDIFGMSRESIAAETDSILEKVKMTEWADKKLGTFSKGMRQRIALGQALMNEPNIIILDEPTSGLDPRGMAEMREILKNLRVDHKDLTVLMSSHMLHEVSDLCDRIALVNHGKLLLHDDIEVITSKNAAKMILVRIGRDITQDIVGRIRDLPYVSEAERYGNEIELKVEGGKDSQMQLYRDLGGMDIGVYHLAENENTLEATYLDLIKESR